MVQNKSSIYGTLILLLGLISAWLIYSPGLSGPFFFDDSVHIVDNPYIKINTLTLGSISEAAVSTKAGPLRRPVSMASFALNHYFFGADAFSYKVVNLLIHLLNGILVFLLAHQLLNLIVRSNNNFPQTNTFVYAAIIAAFWLTHPINLTSVLYIVQRMTSLSALFVLLCLLSYIKARLYFTDNKRLLAISFGLFAAMMSLVAVYSKENAALIPVYIFVIEFVFFFCLKPKSERKSFYLLFWLLVPVTGILLYIFTHSLNYDFRPFDLWERTLTQSRILWFYISLVILPRPSELGIFHDDFVLSTGFFAPWTTFFSITGILFSIGLALVAAKRWPWLSFGILFFFAAHALESSIFPLELAHEHRNYLASFGILFGLVGIFAFTRPEQALFNPKIIGLLGVVFFIFFSVITHGRAITWQDISSLVISQVNRHPESPSSNYEAGRLYILLRDQTSDWLQKDEFNAKAIEYFANYSELAPYQANGPMALILSNAKNSKPSEDAVFQQAIQRLQTGLLGGASANGLTLLLNLSHCVRTDRCYLAPGRIEALLQAPLSNPGLGHNHHAALLSELALQAADQQQFTKAEEYFLESFKYNNILAKYQLDYAAMLIHLNRYEEAKAIITALPEHQQQLAIVQRAIADLEARMAASKVPNSSETTATPLLPELLQPKNLDEQILFFPNSGTL